MTVQYSHSLKDTQHKKPHVYISFFIKPHAPTLYVWVEIILNLIEDKLDFFLAGGGGVREITRGVCRTFNEICIRINILIWPAGSKTINICQYYCKPKTKQI